MNKGIHSTVTTQGRLRPSPPLLANTLTFHHLNCPAQSVCCQASTCREPACVTVLLKEEKGKDRIKGPKSFHRISFILPF